jgi:hypothetical protein
MEESSSKDLLRHSGLSRILQLLSMLHSSIFADSEANPITTLRNEERSETRFYWARLAGAVIASSRGTN